MCDYNLELSKFQKTQVQFRVWFFGISGTIFCNSYAKLKLESEFDSPRILFADFHPIGKTQKYIAYFISKNQITNTCLIFEFLKRD